MPLELGAFDVMEYLWGIMEKTSDGKAVEYTNLDIEMLWQMGFVNTEQYPIDKWRLVFEPYRISEDKFILEKQAFIALDKYRYKGEIHIPFDAMLINEGFYTDEGLGELINLSIEPSCSLQKNELTDFFTTLKNKYRDSRGLIKIDKDAKIEIKNLINDHPSPLRNLEIAFDNMMKKGEDKKMNTDIDTVEADIATARAAMEVSSFSKDPLTKAETHAMNLKKLEKAKTSPQHKTNKKTVSLKKIRRSRKGMRG
ncbi:MAG: hypothetical protein COS89_00820 [Deltaproteobacteria bacterium CG07_land_8_20_14_0_80_38_7]|nr:MAG: hypothetical protein COS89_00820 [Deltaproteobacteria bacterium CG07_land_8_20_14_0_80_38_7]